MVTMFIDFYSIAACAFFLPDAWQTKFKGKMKLIRPMENGSMNFTALICISIVRVLTLTICGVRIFGITFSGLGC